MEITGYKMTDPKKASKRSRWIRRMLETQEEEISCTQCLDLVSQYVDLELAGQAAEERLPQVKHHLDQCRVCREEYEILRELARLDKEGKLPPVDDLRIRSHKSLMQR
jgi:hypothetical protein